MCAIDGMTAAIEILPIPMIVFIVKWKKRCPSCKHGKLVKITHDDAWTIVRTRKVYQCEHCDYIKKGE